MDGFVPDPLKRPPSGAGRGRAGSRSGLPSSLARGFRLAMLDPFLGPLKDTKKIWKSPRVPRLLGIFQGQRWRLPGHGMGCTLKFFPLLKNGGNSGNSKKYRGSKKKNMGICWEKMLIKHGLCKRKSKFFLRQSKVSQLGCWLFSPFWSHPTTEKSLMKDKKHLPSGKEVYSWENQLFFRWTFQQAMVTGWYGWCSYQNRDLPNILIKLLILMEIQVHPP